jgi:spectinomycin phosphotransferase
VRDRPAGVGECDLRLALAEGWRIRAASMRYAAVGGGSYHWAVRDDTGERWFVTVDDLDGKGWLGDTRPDVLAGLRSAMDTALALRCDGALPFVVAPIPGRGGETVRPLGDRHAAAVFPFVNGVAGVFGETLSARERRVMVDMLAALHRSTPAAARARKSTLGLSRRASLDVALCELGRPWRAGPYAEPARGLLAGAAARLRERLAAYDRLAEATATAACVITHGEPHPGNVLRAGPNASARMLVDWDTSGLAPPERDLWMVVGENDQESRRYSDLTGRGVDRGLLAFYRLRWALDDISSFVHQLRSAHDRTADAEHAWLSLKMTVTRLCRDETRVYRDERNHRPVPDPSDPAPDPSDPAPDPSDPAHC